ncbi:LamG-like jellyroll fold domain-containing protein [Paenibacillus caseinilyticus]|uniref:LamG-like jellyroll fold domain-containing protein n=1 Tax=Paenibacillus caseinilyticus TaxID=3098138 RepID=UPI0022B885C2|nr:LamG-like jellyroll fold domain-containing protein [Paenibacillus caseinilyticus]MCZ8519434.1 Ig-like domain-containing protein [Paenibacillus caseinilyticus]
MGNYIDAGTSSLLQPQALTVSYWIKRTESMDARENVVLWFKPENDYAGKGFFITYNGNASIVYVDGANGFYVRQSPDAFLPLNEWTHVAFTFDSSTGEAAIYRNGVSQAIGLDGTPASITATGDVKKIGVSGYGNGAQLRAGLDDFRIYQGAMTASQVKALYEGRDIAGVQPVAVTTETGTAPALPERVSVTYESGGTGAADVSWEAVDPARYAKEGTFPVQGAVEGTNLAAQAQITVSRKDRRAPVTTAAGLPAGWVNRDVLVTLQAEDEGGGTAATYYSIDGGPVQPGTTVQIRGDGTHRLTYWSEDLAGNKETSHAAEVRIDKTAPELTVRLSPAVLKPANHKMVPVTASVYASDSLSSIASVVLTSIVSSEPDNGQGDGDTKNDIQQAEYGTADTRFLLRAERAGRGSGRTYTVTYTARDQAGNLTSSQAIVTVPHH